MPEVRIIRTNEQELHMVGECVGVCWNLHVVRTRRRLSDGSIETIERRARTGEPYIEILCVDERGSEPRISEDSPVEGGFGPQLARQIAQELLASAEYLEALLKSA